MRRRRRCRRRRATLAGPLACLLLTAGLAAGCREAARERPLRLGMYDGVAQLDPHLENEFLTVSVLSHLYEALVTFDAELRIRPCLAERWDNPSDRVWRFYLRPDVTFHDGRPLRAEDVVWSLERARNHPRTEFASYLVAVAGVRALDARTVEITTERAYSVLLQKLAFLFVLPEGSPEAVREPIGTGPYRLLRHDPGERVTLEAFPGYWGQSPAFRRVELLAIPDPGERVQRLLDGEIDLAQALPPAEVARVEGSGVATVALREGLSVEYLETRSDRPPFDDDRVRRALSLALDREALVRELLHGQGVPAGQLVPPMAVGFAPDLAAPAADPDAARRLLHAAGYPDGLDVELEHRAGRPVEPIARQLEAAGIRVRPVGREWQALYERLIAGETSLAYVGLVVESADASDVLDSMGHSPDPRRGYGDGNYGGYRNPELDELIERSGSEPKPLERRILLQECMRLWTRDAPYIPLYVPHELYGVRRGLSWRPRLDGNLLAAEMAP
ncbi:MAG TPA: ABC transporter substrate-binding protein [Thermoanaerobaculia bacterium]|nr:ABC transporter substrate-binding protein [Thermoanaerobaculia bacterium]